MEPDIESIKNIMSTVNEFAVAYGFQLLGAVIILLLGWYFSNYAGRFVVRLCQRFNLDITLAKFFGGIAKAIVLVFVVIIALGKFGITITPLIAALGAVAFGSTLALQGPISNYGAGLTIILTRPFVVGDTIRVLNVTGIVDDIKLAYTQLVSEDGERITIPNKHIVGEIIHNSHQYLVVESVVGIEYDSDTDQAITLIKAILAGHDNVASDPAPQVGIQGFGESSIDIACRYWVPTRYYYQSRFDVNERILSAFRNNGIGIPYPKRDITVYNKTA